MLEIGLAYLYRKVSNRIIGKKENGDMTIYYRDIMWTISLKDLSAKEYAEFIHTIERDIKEII